MTLIEKIFFKERGKRLLTFEGEKLVFFKKTWFSSSIRNHVGTRPTYVEQSETKRHGLVQKNEFFPLKKN